jgi:hypothetical protein
MKYFWLNKILSGIVIFICIFLTFCTENEIKEKLIEAVVKEQMIADFVLSKDLSEDERAFNIIVFTKNYSDSIKVKASCNNDYGLEIRGDFVILYDKSVAVIVSKRYSLHSDYSPKKPAE